LISLRSVLRLRYTWLALFALFALAPRADAEKVAVRDFKPSQMELGRAAAQEYYDEWRDKAAAKHMSLKKYVNKVVVKKINREPLPVVIDPQGRVRNTDGHHRIEALREVEAATGAHFSIKVEVVKDYRGYEQAAYARHFLGTLGKGRFTPEIAALGPEARIAALPTSYPRMLDSPMRSAVGKLFDRLKIKDATFVDYVEFKFGERLMKAGFIEDLVKNGIVRKGASTLPPRLAFDDRVQVALERWLQKPAMRRLLLQNATDDVERQKVVAMLDALAR
jgi:hypothetical protein